MPINPSERPKCCVFCHKADCRFLCSWTQQVDCGLWTLHVRITFSFNSIQHQAMSAHTMPSWNSLLPHTVNSWTLFYKRQVTFSFVQTPIQALTLINWLWPHVLSALANSQRADMEGGRFVMEQRKNDKKGNLWFTKQRSREVSRCTHAQTYSKHLHLIICIPHTCLFRLFPPPPPCSFCLSPL